MISTVRHGASGVLPSLEDARLLLADSLKRQGEAEGGLLERALAFAQQAYGERETPGGDPLFARGVAICAILGQLRLDAETLAAGLLSALPEVDPNHHELLAAKVSPGVAALVDGVQRMAQMQTLSGEVARQAGSEAASQAESLRKMLLAMVQDVRVVLIKLAERVQALRYLAGTDLEQRTRAAQEVMDLFAPLANRLGVWQLKWELEDTAFRLLEPDLYRSIARQLDERRADRERYIGAVMGRLREELAAAGVRAEVSGRPKHIFSIYRKMRRKQVGIDQIYDARALRILVDDVKACYTALGVVHNLWEPIPKEFDDYIARPKGNDYRSLHTAVIGPEGKAVEIQIRTHEMHQHAELGVASHWRYKEGGRHDGRYDEKIAWLRQILEWRDEVSDAREIAEQFKTALFDETVYVLTPQGRVVDLPRGSTPVDFAYSVHSDLGHRCRGARVNGAIVPLNFRLDNGQRVEVIAAKQGGPSRDWLNPDLGYIRSSRARAKVRQWFKNLNLEQTVAEGRAVVEKELQRRGLTALSLDSVAQRAGYGKAEELLLAVARGELSSRGLAQVLEPEAVPAQAEEPLVPRPATPQPSGSGIVVGGVGDLLTVYARCCRPAPPDAIIGYVTRGRGVSVHRADCRTARQLAETHPERLVSADWSVKPGMTFETDLVVEAADRPGLLRDIYEALSRERINIVAANTLTRQQLARMFFTVQVADGAQLSRTLAMVREVRGVLRAARR